MSAVVTAAGKVPPNDLDAERAVLAACLLDAEALDEVADLLTERHWYSDAHRDVWAAIVQLRAAATPADIVLVAQAMRSAGTLERAGGASYLGQLVDGTPATAHVRKHAEVVVELSRLRRAIAVCHERAALGYGSSGDVRGYLGELETEVMRIAAEDAKPTGITLRESLGAVARSMVAAEHGQAIGLETGFRTLDARLGGLKPGDLVVLAARPGMGKSAFAGALARRAADVCSVAWFSLEMPHEQLSARILAAEAGADLRGIHNGRLSEADHAAVNASAGYLERLPITIDDAAALSASDIRSRSRRLASKARKAGPPLGLVLVDYLQLMRHEASKGASRDEQVSQMTRSMKVMARDLGVPVVLLSQLNRGVENRPESERRPRLSDLRESGAIEQDADTVIFLYRPGYYLEQKGQRDESGETEVIVAKQRNGPTGVAKVRWFGSSCSFAEWE